MNFPTNVKYTSEHEWIRIEGDEAIVGITDYAQDQLGDIVFIDIPTEGETLEAGEVLCQNEALADNPELVNQDPYGEGWLIKIKPNNAADIEGLLDAAAYQAGLE